ncbi:MAG: LysR family transcriptional regulator [Burkholderiaceae bacterium]|nr:LysR family transcriptional regulator [Burkholderiaceae bacterium]
MVLRLAFGPRGKALEQGGARRVALHGGLRQRRSADDSRQCGTDHWNLQLQATQGRSPRFKCRYDEPRTQLSDLPTDFAYLQYFSQSHAMTNLDWSDLKHALAVADAGSLAGAARQLGVNHTTVLRRLDALEASLGSRLFDRKRSGYEPTEAGRAMLAHARHMADRVDEIERQVLGQDRELTGRLRVTTAFVIMEHLLPAPLADFARAYPGIEVEVTENAFLVDLSRQRPEVVGQSLAQREADVALRLSDQVAEHLVGRNLGLTQCRVYALRDAPELPQSVQPLKDLVRDAPWVAFEKDQQNRIYDRWMRVQMEGANVRVRVDIFNATAAMLRTGIGVGLLPTFMEAKHPELVPVSDPIPELAAPIWILSHPDLRRTARVRAFMQHVGDALARQLGAA